MKLSLARVFFSVCVALATHASGQTVSVWTGNSGDGQWATAGNWNPNGEPAASNEAIVDTAATIALPTTAVGSLFLQSNAINLTVVGTTFTANDISVDTGATVNLNIGAGASVVSANSGSPNASTFVGDGSGSGVLNLTGGGSLNFTSATLGSGVGIGGTGNFNQSGGTVVNVTAAGQNGFFVIGADGNVSIPSSLPPNSQTALGGVGTYTISQSATLNADSVAIGIGSGLGSGNGTGGSTATTGLLNINGGGVNITNLILGVGSPNSTDTVAHVSGGVSQTAGTAVVSNLDVGVATGAVATYALSGGTLTVSTDLNIGGSGATGSMTLSNTGTLTDNGTFEIGSTGGTGAFTYAGGSLATQGISVGAQGTFNQNASFAPTLASNPITLTNGIYNLNSGTISLGGDTSLATCAIQGTGSFNFAGGTVVTTSAWTDTLNSAFTGTSGLNTAAGAATLSGTLTGIGTLDLTGGNTVNLTGTGNSGSWGINLAGGSTLNATNVNSLSTSGSYAIGSGSTFNLGATGNNVDTFHGNVSDFSNNAGLAMFNLTGFTNANKLVLAGTTALSLNSATNIGAATLEVDHGTISNVTGTNATDTLDIGGSSAGNVRLLGFNSLPVVTVNSGSILLAGNSTAGAFAITGNINNMGGTLGTLGTLNTPAPLLIGGSLTSNGTLLVNSNSLAIDTYGSAAHPLTSATLSGTVKVTGLGSVSNVPIVFTTGGVTATIGSAPGDLMTNAPTALYSSSLAIQGANLVLSTTQGYVTSFAQTPNEAAVGHSIDYLIAKGVPLPTAFIPVLTVFDTLTASQIPAALEELTPESLQYSRNIAFENSTFLALRMNGIDANLRNGVGGLDTNAISIVAPGFDSGLGRSLGSMLAYNSPPYHTPGPMGTDFYPGEVPAASSPYASSSSKHNLNGSSDSGESMSDSTTHEATYQTGQGQPDWSRVSEFIGGDVILADLNRNSTGANAPSSKANYTAGDATAGVSFRITPHLQAGVLFDYNHTDAKTDSSGSRTVVNSYSPGLFATYSDHGFYANGLFSFGYNTYSNNRMINFLNETADSDPSGQQYVGDLDVGYDFHPDKAWIAGPTLGVTYTHLDIDSFTETGAPGADLSIQEQNVDSLRSRLGGHVIYQTRVNYVLLQPNLTAMWQHEYLTGGGGITSSFSDYTTTPFTIQAASVSRDSALLGTGLTATFGNVLSLSLNYTADVNTGDYFAQTIMAGFNARF
jgi:uncharacterized protein YhjY with autotransporter beta-barrel domain